MPTFEIKHPDGSTYEVNAPDEKSAYDAFNTHIMGQSTPANTWQSVLPEAEWGPPPGLSPSKQEDVQSGKTAALGEFAKGVPVAGAFVPQTDTMSQFEKESPRAAKGLQLLGGATTSLPAFAAAPSVLGSSLVGGGMNAADAMARQYAKTGSIDPKATLADAVIGAVGGGLGSAISAPRRAISDLFPRATMNMRSTAKGRMRPDIQIPEWDQLKPENRARISLGSMVPGVAATLHGLIAGGLGEAASGFGESLMAPYFLEHGAWDRMINAPNYFLRQPWMKGPSRGYTQAIIDAVGRQGQ